VALPLQGKRIVLGISGSIGAVQAPPLAARLRALGAEVQPVLTPAARGLVGLAALRDAAGVDPVIALTGKGEHVQELLEGGADLFLVAPCTANTLGQLALGLDDDPVTTYGTVLLGMVPCIVAPAMHDTMWANPAVRANAERLRSMGVALVQPRDEEGSAKLASLETIEAAVLRALGPGTLRGKRVLVVAGPTAEPLPHGLALSNRSTGASGLALAAQAHLLGADTTLWLGATPLPPPPGVEVERFATVQDLLAMAPRTAGFDAVLVPAAIGDYAAAGPPDAEGRVPLRPTPKFVDEVRRHFRGALVAYKAAGGSDEEELLAQARALQQRTQAVLVVANLLAKVGPAETEALLVEGGKATPFRGSKEALARAVLDRLRT
jgi:phosphopantothenoylcysteine decarboxylase / phosphopantothenate---cysteine ligase